MRAFRFWYFGEIFVLLKLTSLAHCSWWWAVFFYVIDVQEGLGYYFRDRKQAAHE